MNYTADKIKRITHCLRMLFLCMENKVLFTGDMLHTFAISCYLTTINVYVGMLSTYSNEFQ